jgi:hypothetical protein
MNKGTGGGRRDRAPEKAGVDPEFAKRFLGRFEGSPVGMDTPLEVAFEAVYRELFAPEGEPSERESAVGEAPETSNLASDTRAAEPNMGLLHEYLKTLGVPESRLPEVAANVHGYALAQAKREVG